MSKNSVSDRAIRLVDYLTRLAYLRATTIRDVEEYSQILWIHEIPQEKTVSHRLGGQKKNTMMTFGSKSKLHMNRNYQVFLTSVTSG